MSVVEISIIVQFIRNVTTLRARTLANVVTDLDSKMEIVQTWTNVKRILIIAIKMLCVSTLLEVTNVVVKMDLNT